MFVTVRSILTNIALRSLSHSFETESTKLIPEYQLGIKVKLEHWQIMKSCWLKQIAAASTAEVHYFLNRVMVY